MVVALFVLIAAVVVVLTTQPKRDAPPTDPPPRKLAVAAPAPAAAAATVAPTPAPVPPTTGDITVPAVITFDESRTARVVAPVAGWLDKVTAKQGRRVRAGETIATMYSVDVLLAEQDLITQIQQFTTQARLDTARRRLLRWYMRPEQVRKVELTGVATPGLPLIAPKDGIVVETTALQGLYTPPAELYTITDPTRVWVIASLPEADAAQLAVGTPAKVKVEGIARPFVAKAAYIYRRVDDGLRQVRFELPAKVQPGATATITIDR